VLDAFGDRLWRETGSVAGAHVCYLLGGRGALETGPEARVLLVGADHASPDSCKSLVSPHALMRTEALLFALGLQSGAGAGQGEVAAAAEALQPFRLVFAMQLCDLGHRGPARAWVDSVRAHASRAAPVFLSQLDQLDARLRGERLWAEDAGGAPAGTRLRFDEDAEARFDEDAEARFEDPFAGAPAAAAPLPSPLTPSSGADPFDSAPPSGARTAPHTPPKPTRALSAPAAMESDAPLSLPPSLAQSLPLPAPSAAAAAAAAAIQPAPPPQQPLAPPPPSSSSSSSAGKAATGGVAEKVDEARGWLVQKIFGLGNATVAKTGQPMSGYYDDKRKLWCARAHSCLAADAALTLLARIFPGDDPNAAGPASLGPPPVVALPSAGPARPAGPPVTMRNRYVVQNS
jgi:hypothetical protein